MYHISSEIVSLSVKMCLLLHSGHLIPKWKQNVKSCIAGDQPGHPVKCSDFQVLKWLTWNGSKLSGHANNYLATSLSHPNPMDLSPSTFYFA